MNRTTLTIYISSPGDVTVERLALVRALDRLSMEPFARDKADLWVVSYNHPTLELPLPANENPQVMRLAVGREMRDARSGWN